MKNNKLILAASAGLMLMLAGNVMGKQPPGLPGCAPDCVRNNPVSAPEINMDSGSSAIALLAIALLLVAERSRRI
jgi:hypothetical protein